MTAGAEVGGGTVIPLSLFRSLSSARAGQGWRNGALVRSSCNSFWCSL